MKKIFSAFIIAVGCMFMAMPAQAQLIKWGVKGGVNLTKIDWDGGIDKNKKKTLLVSLSVRWLKLRFLLSDWVLTVPCYSRKEVRVT